MKVGPRVRSVIEADDEAERHGDQPGEREGDEGRDAEIGEEDRRRVSADREEDVVAERDVAGVAADDVPARGDRDVHEDEEQHVQPVVHATDGELQQREGERGDEQDGDQRALAGDGRRGGGEACRRRSSPSQNSGLLPSRPCGRTSRITNSAR